MGKGKKVVKAKQNTGERVLTRGDRGLYKCDACGEDIKDMQVWIRHQTECRKHHGKITGGIVFGKSGGGNGGGGSRCGGRARH